MIQRVFYDTNTSHRWKIAILLNVQSFEVSNLLSFKIALIVVDWIAVLLNNSLSCAFIESYITDAHSIFLSHQDILNIIYLRGKNELQSNACRHFFH